MKPATATTQDVKTFSRLTYISRFSPSPSVSPAKHYSTVAPYSLPHEECYTPDQSGHYPAPPRGFISDLELG
jgi:hypothetical protein